MKLELADRSISEPIGIVEDVYVTVGKFQFPANFVVVDFEPDPRVPLILGRSFLKTSRALIDVYEGEITLRVDREAITFNLDQTLRYTANYNHMTANRIDVINMAYEEYSQEVLGFSNVISSGNPTPYYDPIVSTTSPTLTPFGVSEFFSFSKENEAGLFSCYRGVCGDDKLPVIIEKDLKNEEKAALIEVLKSHKRAIAWKLLIFKGIGPRVLYHQNSMVRTRRNPYGSAIKRRWVHGTEEKKRGKLLDILGKIATMGTHRGGNHGKQKSTTAKDSDAPCAIISDRGKTHFAKKVCKVARGKGKENRSSWSRQNWMTLYRPSVTGTKTLWGALVDKFACLARSSQPMLLPFYKGKTCSKNNYPETDKRNGYPKKGRKNMKPNGQKRDRIGKALWKGEQ
ncbi:reverse transcriptase domain-containing protein [Tanacetum coccineum]